MQVRAAMHVLLTEKVGKPLLLPSRFLCTDNANRDRTCGRIAGLYGDTDRLAFPAIPRGQKLPDDLGGCVYRCTLYKQLEPFFSYSESFHSILTPWDLSHLQLLRWRQALPFA